MDTTNKFTSRSFHNHLSTTFATAAAFLVAANIASAHPGHDFSAQPVTHLLTSPYHMLVLALVGGGLLLGANYIHRLVPRRALQLSGVAALIIAGVAFASRLSS